VAENGSLLIVKLNIVGYSSGVRTPGWHPWLGDPRVGLTLTTVGGLKIASDFLTPVSRRIGFLLRPQAWFKSWPLLACPSPSDKRMMRTTTNYGHKQARTQPSACSLPHLDMMPVHDETLWPNFRRRSTGHKTDVW